MGLFHAFLSNNYTVSYRIIGRSEVVIIAGVQKAINVESGIYSFVTETYGETSDVDYFDKNFGPGKLFPGGLVCKFNNKEILCLLWWTPKRKCHFPDPYRSIAIY